MGSKTAEKPCVTAPPDPPEAGCVEIRGARQNNLKGIDLDLPLGKLTVVTGPSGSGKSSLAFDTIYAEGQRRCVETFSPYMRQFLDRMDKPRVDEIRGIPPAIAIEQANPVKSSRSTVGTMTEINDYLKLLMPCIARAFCPGCGREIRPETARSIADDVVREFAGETVLLTFWVGVPAKTDPHEFFQFLQQQGYLRVWLNCEIVRADTDKKVGRLGARVQVIQDRLTIGEETRARLIESIETALRFGKDRINFVLLETKKESPFSTGWHCAHCDLDIRPPTPGLFSFNNPLGACPTCRGFGRTIAIDLNRAIPDHSLSIAGGVVRAFQGQQFGESQKDLLRACAREEIDVRIPFEDLPKADQDFVINGETRDTDTDVEELAENDRWYGVRGFFKWLESKTYKMHVRVLLSRYRAYTTCSDCNGGRFQLASLNYRIVSRAQGDTRETARTLPEVAMLSIADARELFADLALPPNDSTAAMLRNEVVTRLRYLCEVGLGYLTLDRSTRTLSGGEVQRVNLTTCLGASLVNTLFVMDEPSVGLHPRDVGRLVRVMHDLRDKGNTLLVVEHEEAIIRSSDHVVDIGPGRGERGGELVFSGELADLHGLCAPRAIHHSLTADYLSGRKRIPVPKRRRVGTTGLRITGAREHNLKDLDVEIPLGIFNCITGVSGSGKSTLIHEVLYRNLLQAKGQPSEQEPGACKSVTGAHRIGDVVMVDQSILARTPRSTPILYLGLYDRVRELFAAQPEAMAQGLTASAFSFNSGSGRCERCCGTGFEKIEMQFLSDLYVRCAECEGRRFQPHVLRVQLHGKSIHDVLQLTVSEAIEFFTRIGESEKLGNPLDVLDEVGLGYLRLGQPLNTLSGGESQRLKLVRHLADESAHAKQNGSARGNLLIFDEPTTGLHFDDVAMLVKLFQRLVEAGNTIIVIEHNLEVIKCADWVIDLGPEAGDEGGTLVAAGTPEAVARIDGSHTGAFLRPVLQKGSAGSQPAVRGILPRSLQPRYALDDSDLSLRAAEEPPSRMQDGTGWKPALPDGTNNAIRIHGAREHNLKNVSLDIPRDKMVI
ncbi:MAG TPA: excinuclease ABC subunit UvrA, partial [Chthoniobacterales bacterium]